ncbi:hypothetical protein DSO57_1002718 [Entomophthora muscae]|uniref:Uncharacterized protein n=1 Tax=Entomophthora muscae TaxID=34485 RepID=A0ACC2UUU7_9FUNG|nr:hypothetical protein DSO57_1002718 [Entomophthora muscae]
MEESTWKLLSNLTNAQEAIQLYLNKKNQEEGDPGEEGDDVKIDNSSPLKTQAQERESNPEPGFPRATGPIVRDPVSGGWPVIFGDNLGRVSCGQGPPQDRS